jgi:hypothetical protein
MKKRRASVPVGPPRSRRQALWPDGDLSEGGGS